MRAIDERSMIYLILNVTPLLIGEFGGPDGKSRFLVTSRPKLLANYAELNWCRWLATMGAERFMAGLVGLASLVLAAVGFQTG
jgi:hypothetical protein